MTRSKSGWNVDFGLSFLSILLVLILSSLSSLTRFWGEMSDFAEFVSWLALRLLMNINRIVWGWLLSAISLASLVLSTDSIWVMMTPDFDFVDTQLSTVPPKSELMFDFFVFFLIDFLVLLIRKILLVITFLISVFGFLFCSLILLLLDMRLVIPERDVDDLYHKVVCNLRDLSLLVPLSVLWHCTPGSISLSRSIPSLRIRFSVVKCSISRCFLRDQDTFGEWIVLDRKQVPTLQNYIEPERFMKNRHCRYFVSKL